MAKTNPWLRMMERKGARPANEHAGRTRGFSRWKRAGLVLMALGVSTPLLGQIYTSVEEASVYPSFPFQGEYAGTVTLNADTGPVEAGLQVAAYGENDFRARLYHGGLPGAGRNAAASGNAVAMEGKFEDHILELTGEDGLRFRYGSNGFTAIDEDDGALGRLTRVVRKSPTLGWAPPEKAVVLFDGTGLDHWQDNAAMTDERLLKEGATTAEKYGDMQLHLEARHAFMPERRDQNRSNSGIYIQNRYEVQVLDSFALPAAFNGNTALYRVVPPELNASYPPLTWQSYDIFFRAPRFDAAGEKTENARVTVYLNGVLVQDDLELENGTGRGGQREEVARAELLLQDHACPVRFRNVWLVKDEYAPPGTRILAPAQKPAQ